MTNARNPKSQISNQKFSCFPLCTSVPSVVKHPSLTVAAHAEEKLPLQQAIYPIVFGHLPHGQMVAGAANRGGHLTVSIAAAGVGGPPGAEIFDQLLRMLQDYATPRALPDEVLKAAEEFALIDRGEQVAVVLANVRIIPVVTMVVPDTAAFLVRGIISWLV